MALPRGAKGWASELGGGTQSRPSRDKRITTRLCWRNYITKAKRSGNDLISFTCNPVFVHWLKSVTAHTMIWVAGLSRGQMPQAPVLTSGPLSFPWFLTRDPLPPACFQTLTSSPSCYSRP